MIAGPDHVIDLHLFHVCLFAIKPNLPTPLIYSAIANIHGVVGARQRMQEMVVFGEVFDEVIWRRPIERPTHAGAAVALVDLAVTFGANP